MHFSQTKEGTEQEKKKKKTTWEEYVVYEWL